MHEEVGGEVGQSATGMEPGGELEGDFDRRLAHVLSDLGIQDYSVHSRARGQNNDVITIQTASDGGTELVFRFPRHALAVEELAREVTLLSALRGHLPVPIPDPRYVRLAPPEPGKVFMGYPKLPGAPLRRAHLETLPSTDGREGKWAIASQLGAFLMALHTIPPAQFDPPLATTNDRDAWARMYADVRAGLFPAMRPDARQQVALHFESYLDDMASSSWEPTLIHGDFGPGNILYDASSGTLSGIIDWSSAGLGDPATDLAALIGPVSYGEDFADLLAPTYLRLAHELPRARFYAGTFALQEALFGLQTGDAEAFEAGIADYR